MKLTKRKQNSIARKQISAIEKVNRIWDRKRQGKISYSTALKQVSKTWEKYRDDKSYIIYKDRTETDSKGLVFEKRKQVSGYSLQEWFKFKKGSDKDKIINKIFENKKVKGVLLIMKIYQPELDLETYVSEFLPSIDAVQRRIEANGTLENALIYKLRSTEHYDPNFTVKEVYIRVIYANPVPSKKKK